MDGDERHNIVIVLTDEQRWDTLGCYGYPRDVSPNLDRLAAEGVRFSHAFTCCPVCGPARAAIQTGRYPSETGCIANNIRLPANEQTIAHHLAAAGYETAYFGKWHLASDSNEGEDCFWTRPIPSDRRGGWGRTWVATDVPEYTSHSMAGYLFDAKGERREFAERYRADAFTDLAVDYLLHRHSRRPLLMFLSLVEPHPQPYHRHYVGPDSPRTRPEHLRQIAYEGPDDIVGLFRDAPLPAELIDARGIASQYWPDYLAACARIDTNVGRLVDAFEKAGLWGNTLFIFTSDHGDHFLTRHPDIHKCTCHDASIRIPLVLHGPGLPCGVVSPHFANIVDIAPTVLAAAGLDVPASMRGTPLLDYLCQPVRQEQQVYIQTPEPVRGHVLRTERFTYAVREAVDEDGAPCCHEDALYDNQSDPHQQDNLVMDRRYEAIRAACSVALSRRMAKHGAAVLPIRPWHGSPMRDEQ